MFRDSSFTDRKQQDQPVYHFDKVLTVMFKDSENLQWIEPDGLICTFKRKECEIWTEPRDFVLPEILEPFKTIGNDGIIGVAMCRSKGM